jgi:hypothetical protein
MGHDCSIRSALLHYIWAFGAQKQRFSPGWGIFPLPSSRCNRPIDTASTGPSEPAKASDAGELRLSFRWATIVGRRLESVIAMMGEATCF